MQKTQHESSSSASSASSASAPPVSDEPDQAETDTPLSGHREYDRSGLYPSGGGKAFRIWALLGWLAAVIVVLAGVSALLNILLLD